MREGGGAYLYSIHIYAKKLRGSCFCQLNSDRRRVSWRQRHRKSSNPGFGSNLWSWGDGNKSNAGKRNRDPHSFHASIRLSDPFNPGFHLVVRGLGGSALGFELATSAAWVTRIYLNPGVHGARFSSQPPRAAFSQQTNFETNQPFDSVKKKRFISQSTHEFIHFLSFFFSFQKYSMGRR